VAVNTLTFRLGQNLNLAISATDVRSAIAKRSSEPQPLSELAKNSLLAEFGLGGKPGSEPAKTSFDPDILAEIEKLLEIGRQPLKSYAETPGPLFSDQKKAWALQISTAYDQSGNHSPRWDAHVQALMRDRDREDKAAVQKAAQAILDADCQDPAALMLSALAILPDDKALAVARRAERGLAASGYPLTVRYKLRVILFVIQTQFPDEQEKLPKTLDQIRREFLEVLRDPKLSDLDRRMIYEEARKILVSLLQGREVEFLEQLESAVGIDPWLKDMLSGLIHHTLGWRARGSGYADGISPQQWDVFHAKLAQAQSHWLNAWRKKPGFPEAATELLRATMAYQGVAEEDERFWFERAVEAQFDYEPAYQSYLWAIRPRWGGSHEMMLAFGRECEETKRFDTQIPWQFHEAVQAVASELGDDGSNIYGRFGIADDYLQILEGYRQQTQNPARQCFLDSQTACVLLLSGRTIEAKKIVDRLGKDIDERGFEAFDADMPSLLKSLDP
jgi:hypothetical protein